MFSCRYLPGGLTVRLDILFGGMNVRTARVTNFLRVKKQLFPLNLSIMTGHAGGKRKHYKEYLWNPELSVPERTATRYKQSGSRDTGI